MLNTPLAYTAGSQAPAACIPADACDCHLHVYDCRFPSAAGAVLLPPDASVAQYRALRRRLGTQRAVFVTPSTYGTDNRLLLLALREMGEKARGVAVVDGSESDEALMGLHQAGVRGIRLNLSLGVSGSLQDLPRLAQRAAALGWHVQLLMPADLLASCGDLLRGLPVQLVFDHMARLSPAQVFRHPAHALVLDLLRKGKAWVKLSGGYIVSPSGSVEDPGLDALARSFIETRPDRVVWGSDWPHATASAGRQPMPDDARQLDRLSDWAGDTRTFHRILVDNPCELYQFTWRSDPQVAVS